MLNHDAGELEFRAAELAHRELEDRIETATECCACGACLGKTRYPSDDGALCPTCARQFVSAFLPEILAASSGTRWGDAR